jgi:hypothetical protein
VQISAFLILTVKENEENNSSSLPALWLFASHSSAQFIDFPAGYDGKPESPIKGPVHTVLAIEQREEQHIFRTTVETYFEGGMTSRWKKDIQPGKLMIYWLP